VSLYAPSVDVRFLDGNDPAVMELVWPASDVFVSMVDNIQETFGITPVEAMAAGLPVVVSDWDGYRFTVPHGTAGFRVPTLIAPAGTGGLMAQRHALSMDTYQLYVAQVAAHVAVNVRATVDGLAALAEDPRTAAAMGAAAREHARRTFDWAAVVPQFVSLFEELAEIRRSALGHEHGPAPRVNPARNDPFEAFAGFATDVLADGTQLRRAGANGPAIADQHGAAMNAATKAWRLAPAQTERILALFDRAPQWTVAEIVDALAEVPREGLQRHLMWMCKVGLLDWIHGDLVPVDAVAAGGSSDGE